MKITRLSWAGLMLESPDATLYIDPLQNVSHMAPFLGVPKFPVFPVPFPRTVEAGALVTHIHPDHFDQPLLRELVGKKGEIFGPGSVAAAGLLNGININAINLYDTLSIAGFDVTAVPAVDWVGDEQVSYVVSDGKHTILHGGDTNWHGYWWPIAQKYGPFDAVFLQVNGVTGAVPGVLPAVDIFGTMTPFQAVAASKVLGAEILVPIHYGQFDNAPAYTEFADLENVLTQSAADHQISVKRLNDGEVLELR